MANPEYAFVNLLSPVGPSTPWQTSGLTGASRRKVAKAVRGRIARAAAANLWKWTGDLKRALAILEEGVKTGVNGEPVLVELSAIHEALGDTAAAISDWENVRAIIASLPAAGSGRRARSIDAGHRIAQLHRRAGRPAQAAALYAEFLPQARQLAKDFPDEQRGPSLVALMLAGRGEKAEALAALDEAKQFGARGRDASELARIRNASAEVLALLARKTPPSPNCAPITKPAGPLATHCEPMRDGHRCAAT